MQENFTKEQLIEYAKNHDSERVKFSVNIDGKYALCGDVLDAYSEFVVIPRFDNHFMFIDDFMKLLTGTVTFNILTFDLYRGFAMADLIKCGKEIPEHFMEEPY